MVQTKTYEPLMIRDRYWSSGISENRFVWQQASYSYSQDLNTLNEPHWLKLSTRPAEKNGGSVRYMSVWNSFISFPVSWTGQIKLMNKDTRASGGSNIYNINQNVQIVDSTVFQDNVWVLLNTVQPLWGILSFNVTWAGQPQIYLPYDHLGEDISDPDTRDEWPTGHLVNNGTCIFNYQNQFLLVGAGNVLWGYFPRLDTTPGSAANSHGYTGWKKITTQPGKPTYEPGTTIIDITAEWWYIKVWTLDEWRNTKIHYYPATFDMEDGGVTNTITRDNTRITRVFSDGTRDYFTSSIDGSDAFINLYTLVGWDKTLLWKTSAGLIAKDPQQKIGYFIWPSGPDAAFYNDSMFIQDSRWVREFKKETITPNGEALYPATLRWRVGTGMVPTGMCVCENYLYCSYDNGKEYKINLVDTGKDKYSKEGYLVSREIETELGGEYTKVLDSIDVFYEGNNLASNKGKIELFVAMNMQWNDVDTDFQKVGEITSDDMEWHTMSKRFTPNWTRFEESQQDFNTLAYKVKITQWDEDTTPVLRGLLFNYHPKNKTAWEDSWMSA